MAQSQARGALHELIELLRAIDERCLSPEWGASSADEVAGAARWAMHLLQGGLVSHFEDSPDHPLFRPTLGVPSRPGRSACFARRPTGCSPPRRKAT